MRNCFVPKCDAQCKSQPKRMMFIPPKDKKMYNLWKDVLPKRREFKHTDKVCERHFRKEDIITTFDHIINGQLFQMERGRPKLKPDAVPCLNLPTEDQYVRRGKRKQQKTSRKSSNIKEEEILLQLSSDQSQTELEKSGESDKRESEEELQLIVNDEDGSEASILVRTITLQQSADKKRKYSSRVNQETREISEPEEKISKVCEEFRKSNERTIQANEDEITTEIEIDYQSLFDYLYDDIYEVTLPSTLWGLHRDPERNFITFTYLDPSLLRVTKLITLDSKGLIKICINDKIYNDIKLETEITHEFLSNLVTEIDEIRICKKIDESDSCLLRADENSDLCQNCLL